MYKLELEFDRLDAAAAARLEGAAGALKGVVKVDVWTSGRARLEFADRADAEAAAPALADAGWTVRRSRISGGEEAGRLRLNVAGMHCRSCEVLLEDRIGRLAGVRRVRADAAAGTADIELEPGASPDREAITAAVAKEGYRVSGAETGERARPSWPSLLIAFAASGALVWLMFRYGGSPAGILSGGPVSFVGAMVIGLVAGVHSCLAVSGGLLMSAAARFNAAYRPATRLGRQRPVLLFVGGRVLSYAVLGGAIGWLGGALLPSPAVTGALIVLAGLFMLAAGLDMLGLAPRWFKRLTPDFAKPLGRRVVGWQGAGGWAAPFLVGAATFFVPCGFTQALQIYALSTHSFAAGAVTLGGFALGTAPALFGLGLAAGASNGRVGRAFFRLAGATVVILGLVSLQSGVTVAGINFWTPRSAAVGTSDLPPIVAGEQVIRMVVGGSGAAYSPDHFTVLAGTPVRWEIDERAAGCLSFVVAQTLGINAPLKQGMNVVRFTPEKAGTHVFSCSMGMYKGTITVVPRV